MTTTMRDVALGEVKLAPEDFRAFAAMAREASGIMLGETKRELVASRLGRRLRALRLSSYREYRTLVEGPDGEDERVRMINAITTNLTGFFREVHHFDYLAANAGTVLDHASRRARIWSAGCSSGEEPYTIAMTLLKAIPDLARWDARILATDIDTDMVAAGNAGLYKAERVESIPMELRRRHVLPADNDMCEMSEEARALIAFRQLNLLGDWPMRGKFDAIFCRNVVIYFDKPTQRTLFDRFADMLKPEGHLFIGHSETLHNVSDRFVHLGRTIHRKVR